MRSRWLAETAPPLLGAVAEGAWIAVVAAAVSAPLGGPGPLGALAPTLVAALIGAGVARLLPATPSRWATLLGVAILVVAVAFVVGRAGGIVPASGPQPVLIYPILGLAVLRGAVQGDPGAGDLAVGELVRRSPLLLGAGWVLGLTVAGEGHAAFVREASLATLTFVVAAALALGSARLAVLTSDPRDRIGGNGAWLVLVLLIVACAALAALPLALVLGRPLGTIAGGLATALLTVVFGVAGALVGVIFFAVDAVAGLLRSLLGLATTQPASAPGSQAQVPTIPAGGEPSSDPVDLVLRVVVLLVLAVSAWYLAVRWQGGRRAVGPVLGAPERRSIVLDLGVGLPAIHLPRRLRMLRPPRDALEAYPRLLDDWARQPSRARDPAETPAAHAARLRSEGHGDLALDLLSADYQLARFGDVRLTACEDRRAVGRWRRLRHAPAPSGEPPDEEVPRDTDPPSIG